MLHILSRWKSKASSRLPFFSNPPTYTGTTIGIGVCVGVGVGMGVGCSTQASSYFRSALASGGLASNPPTRQDASHHDTSASGRSTELNSRSLDAKPSSPGPIHADPEPPPADQQSGNEGGNVDGRLPDPSPKEVVGDQKTLQEEELPTASKDQIIKEKEEAMYGGENGSAQRSNRPDPAAHEAQVLALFDSILQHDAKRSDLQNLVGADAQLVINFLDYISLAQRARQDLAHRQRTNALYSLSRSSQLYPQPYLLRDVTKAPVAHGSGGLCDVFQGRYEDLGVSLKVVRVFRDKEIRTATKILAKEVILWGQLYHPNIVPLYGLYSLELESAPRVCLVSPWMNNGNLDEYLENYPNAPRKPLVYDIACGLDYLHQQGIVHGDMKGTNILIDDAGVACITDFGLFSVTTDDIMIRALATTTVNHFHLRWTAPEALEMSYHDRANDIWALGCLFYQILSRLLPFYESTTDVAVLRRLGSGARPTRPTEGALKEGSFDAIEDGPWALMERCWASEPENRPACQEILACLKDLHFDLQPRRERLSDIDDCIRFRLAMREKSNRAPIDLQGVEDILIRL